MKNKENLPAWEILFDSFLTIQEICGKYKRNLTEKKPLKREDAR